MIIDALFEVLQRPTSPVETGSDEDWVRVFRRVGTRLPEDYVQFIKAYGTGLIDGFNWIYNPFAKNGNFNLVEQIPIVLSSFRDLKKESPQSFRFPLFFEPDGLLPWGGTIDGDCFFWRTSKLIDHWPVVVVPRHDDEAEFHDLPMTGFLADVLSGRRRSKAFPTDYSPADGHHFEPAEEPKQ